MTIAGWDTPFTRFLLLSLDDTQGIDVNLLPAEEAFVALKSGQADVALLPADLALLHPEDLDVLPGVAVSTWSNPYASIELPEGFQTRRVRLVAGNSAHLQGFVASLVLREHYGVRVEGFVGQDETPEPASGRERASVDASLQPATLIAQTLESEGEGTPITLDLGQEWVELTNYPMVWGLFVTRRKEATPEKIRQLIKAVKEIDEARPSLLQSGPAGDREAELHEEFCLNELRVRLDDLAVASLTELSEFLYFFGQADSVPGVILASLPVDSDSAS